MTEHFLDHIHRNPCGQHETGSSVATVVQPDAGQPARLLLLVQPLRDGVGVVRIPQLVGDQAIAVLVGAPAAASFSAA